MSDFWDNQRITVFVRDVLGCGCPDEVFRRIEVSRAKIGNCLLDVTRINIGDTLLIYIIRPEMTEELSDTIKGIASLGKEDRNAHGYNRFRAVVAVDHGKTNTNLIREIFAAEIGEDEKMHLHFVDAESVGGL